MPDMLVKLYRLPSAAPAVERARASGVEIRRAQPYEREAVYQFVLNQFSQTWADETMVAFTHQPVTAYIALDGKRIVGFAAYECTRRDYFGPTGVQEAYRGRGIGEALLILSLQGLYEMGYGYAIIGGVGPAEFYSKVVGAELIVDSVPGIYTPAAEITVE